MVSGADLTKHICCDEGELRPVAHWGKLRRDRHSACVRRVLLPKVTATAIFSSGEVNKASFQHPRLRAHPPRHGCREEEFSPIRFRAECPLTPVPDKNDQLTNA